MKSADMIPFQQGQTRSHQKSVKNMNISSIRQGLIALGALLVLIYSARTRLIGNQVIDNEGRSSGLEPEGYSGFERFEPPDEIDSLGDRSVEESNSQGSTRHHEALRSNSRGRKLNYVYQHDEMTAESTYIRNLQQMMNRNIFRRMQRNRGMMSRSKSKGTGKSMRSTGKSRSMYRPPPLFTRFPTFVPQSEEPSLSPTASVQPSMLPSQVPSDRPSVSSQPSAVPSELPSVSPSTAPSSQPSASPTLSAEPSAMPSNVPSKTPSISPSALPSVSVSPSNIPSLSTVPSAVPSSHPTNFPTFFAIRGKAMGKAMGKMRSRFTGKSKGSRSSYYYGTGTSAKSMGGSSIPSRSDRGRLTRSDFTRRRRRMRRRNDG